MFRAGLLLIIRRINSVQTAIGVMCHVDYTDCCLYIVDPPDDEQQACSKHVEAYYWKKLIENSASFWFILYEVLQNYFYRKPFLRTIIILIVLHANQWLYRTIWTKNWTCIVLTMKQANWQKWHHHDRFISSHLWQRTKNKNLSSGIIYFMDFVHRLVLKK